MLSRTFMSTGKKLKFLFLVQGEGRGHMMQALALRDLLEAMGHSVTRICLGKSQKRQVPEFFLEEAGEKLLVLDSPGFVTDRRDRGVKPFLTVVYNALRIFTFLKSLATLRRTIRNDRPDAVINFYELLGGLYTCIFPSGVPFICIGHQCMIVHPSFVFPQGHVIGKFLMRSLYKLTSHGSVAKIALSLGELPDVSEKNLYVAPPLLRKSFKEQVPESGNFILAYMTNSGYAADVEKGCRENPQVQVKAFGDALQSEEVYKPLKNLTFYRLQGEKFREALRRCKGVMTTAGFETVCEAAYLGKPVLAVPMKKQYEQACNAAEAEEYGLAVQAERFDPALIDRYADEFYTSNRSHAWFRTWCDASEESMKRILDHILK